MEPKEGGNLQRLRDIALGAKDKLSGFLRKNRIGSEVAMTASLASVEANESPFDLASYHYVRDSLMQLQLGFKFTKDGSVDMVLSEETAATSSLIGRSGYWIGQKMVLGLREERRNANGVKNILCVDEVSDGQVLKNATEEERKTFFAKAVNEAPQALRFADQVGRDAFIVSATALAMILFKSNLIQAGKVVEEALNLNSSIVFSSERVKNLVKFLRSNPQRIIKDDKEDAFANGPSEIKPIGEEALEIEGKEWQVAGAGKIAVEVTPKEDLLINSFRRVIHEGRQAMAKQALLFAEAYLGESKDNLEKIHPPQSFINPEIIEGLKSDEILVFLPQVLSVQIQNQVPVPDFIKQLHSSGVNKTGWYRLKLVADGNKITQVVRLVRLY